jgi:hypothetical protein
VDKVIEKVLEAAAKQWLHAPAPHSYSSIPGPHMRAGREMGKVDRIIEIIEQTIISANLDVCRTLFVDVLKNTGTSAEKFTQTYTPLIPRLRVLLQARNIDLWVPPFVDLFQILVGSYLRDVLGKKKQNI